MPTGTRPTHPNRLFALVVSTLALTGLAVPAHATAALPDTGTNVTWNVVTVVVLLVAGGVLLALRRGGTTKADDGGGSAAATGGDGGAGGGGD